MKVAVCGLWYMVTFVMVKCVSVNGGILCVCVSSVMLNIITNMLNLHLESHKNE